jgi:hypothetical protein
MQKKKLFLLLPFLIVFFGFVNINSYFAEELTSPITQDGEQSEEGPVDESASDEEDPLSRPGEIWSQPINLSLSGAASQPFLLVGPDGITQAFWWDRFDGLTRSIFDGENWTHPTGVPVELSQMTSTPNLYIDNNGWVHAFWREAETGETLYHSRIQASSTEWTEPQIVAESATNYSVAILPGGGISLAYYRTLHTPEFPAGVYVKRLASGDWQASRPVYTSIYYRLLSPGQAQVSLVASIDGTLHLAWETPHEGQAWYAASGDGGVNWSEAEPLGADARNSTKPRLAYASNGDVIRIWEPYRGGGCEFYQQQYSQIQGTEDSEPGRSWGPIERIFEGSEACPTQGRFWNSEAGLLWIWNEGSSNVSISFFDYEERRWTRPQRTSMLFEDNQSGNQITLNDMRISVMGDHLMVAGADPVGGEVWVSSAPINLLDFNILAKPAWTTPALITSGRELGAPAVALDANGSTYVAWSQPQMSNNTQASLFFSRSFGGEFTPPLEIHGAVGGAELARQPVLLSDNQDRLHLVWSDGLEGIIQYRRAILGAVAAPHDWSPAQILAGSGFPTWPQIGVDSAGNIYVVYVASLNEERGVYLVRSEDGGNNWSEPKLIFDGVSEGIPMVDQPGLAVEADGKLHVTWVNGALPGEWMPAGIFYTISIDHGENWADPIQIAGEGYDRPRLALASNQLHLLFYTSNDGIWHRWAPLTGPEEGTARWSVPGRIPGWQQVVTPFGVAVDGSNANGVLHLVGATKGGSRAIASSILYNIWNGQRWESVDFIFASALMGSSQGVSAVTRPEGGLLAAVWVTQASFVQDVNTLSFYTVTRAIPKVEIPETVVQIPPTPDVVEPTQVLEDEIIVPTPTPNLNLVPIHSEDPFNPLVLGGGLAGLTVAAIFGLRILWNKKH